MTKDNHKIMEGIHLLVGDFPELLGFLAACPDASAAVNGTKSYLTYWAGQGTMKIYSTGYRNLRAHKSEVVADANIIENDYLAGDYYNTAVEAAALAQIALPKPTGQQLGKVGAQTV